MRFGKDLRVQEIRRLLQSSKPVTVSVIQKPEVRYGFKTTKSFVKLGRQDDIAQSFSMLSGVCTPPFSIFTDTAHGYVLYKGTNNAGQNSLKHPSLPLNVVSS